MTPAERLYFCFSCLLGAVMQASIFGSFANVLASGNKVRACSCCARERASERASERAMQRGGWERGRLLQWR